MKAWTLNTARVASLAWAGAMIVGCSMIDGLTGNDLFQELEVSGLPATAVVIEIRETGITVNQTPVVDFLLEIHAENLPPYEAESKALVSILAIPQIQPGAELAVLYDPRDPQRVAIDLSRHQSRDVDRAHDPEKREDIGGLVMNALELEELDVAALGALMESGRLTATELTRYYLDRIATLDEAGPRLNAMLTLNPDALKIATALDEEKVRRGPLHGIPIVLKANIDTGDQMETTAGSLALAGHHAQRDAFLVARLREAGAVILGKANLSEWANFRSEKSSSGWSSEGRQTRNPYVLDRNPCGSSSGSAVAVAANLAALAVGTETDGSVVCPASANGIVGIKPSLGLVSRAGIIPIAHSQDTAGPMARTVRDAAILLTAMVAADSADPAFASFPDEVPDYLAALDDGSLEGVRIGIMPDYYGAGKISAVDRLFERAAAKLEDLGATTVALDPEALEREGLNRAEYEVLLYEFKSDLEEYLVSHGSPNGMASLADLIAFNTANAESVMPYFDQEVFLAAEAKGPLTDKAYEEALESSKRIAQGVIDGALEDHRLDLIIAPTNGPAWPSDPINGDHFVIASSTLAAVAGYPNITVPMGQVHDLPVGLSFFSTAFAEPTLLRVAHAFERATGARRPPRYLPTLDLE